MSTKDPTGAARAVTARPEHRRIRVIPAREVVEGDVLHSPSGIDTLVESVGRDREGSVVLGVWRMSTALAPDAPVEVLAPTGCLRCERAVPNRDPLCVRCTALAADAAPQALRDEAENLRLLSAGSETAGRHAQARRFRALAALDDAQAEDRT